MGLYDGFEGSNSHGNFPKTSSACFKECAHALPQWNCTPNQNFRFLIKMTFGFLRSSGEYNVALLYDFQDTHMSVSTSLKP